MNLLWTVFDGISSSALWKDCFAVFKVRVTAKVQNFIEWLSITVTYSIYTLEGGVFCHAKQQLLLGGAVWCDLFFNKYQNSSYALFSSCLMFSCSRPVVFFLAQPFFVNRSLLLCHYLRRKLTCEWWAVTKGPVLFFDILNFSFFKVKTKYPAHLTPSSKLLQLVNYCCFVSLLFLFII